ncbi:methyl-accepting chemotaxis protein [Pseudomonas syringae]|uniref:Methyl-accepting chemotaxis protein n=1 Tax=Pseudomonas syringae TaxID=317 RepID=A0A6B2AW36_PSESX|nr:methyl-accepting chemotaxis protein [Pseudomonas syringae]AKF51950.1 Methyl-accepting chemotaxis protein [Pseudomonas syringae pv. syringae HS191]MBI6557813.1 methyl-accepting chemotaxis protein [Pseudomonas syringae]MBI6570058.1 methyl-accepting chemotaxis protein [Pseudomonas syringae]MBI6588839.1 methyl-accepting chemotaxis protein [Pseudomonas syringae]MBI6594680.1 methyl-accepting chemotaxis protein [Pseudomonas syringae]
MRNVKVAVRAGMSFMLITCLLIALGGIALWKMGELRTSMESLEKDAMASIIQASKISSATLRLRLDARRLIAQTDLQAQTVTVTRLKTAREDMLKQSAAYAPMVNAADEASLYQTVTTSAQKFASLLDTVLELVQKGANADAVTFTDTNIVPVTGELQAAIDALVQMNIDQADQLSVRAEAAYESGFMFTVVIIIVSLIITIFLAILLTRSIVTPLKSLLSVNERIASGDLRGDIPVTGNDEFSELQRSTLAMQKNLRQTIGLIGNSSQQLASAAEEMNSITVQSSTGLGRQNQEIEQAATAVNEMTAAVDEVARNAAAASDAAKESNASTVRGAARVASTVTAIEKLSATVLATSADVQRLAGQSNDISKVLAVIRTIAEQTNLLALNAAIEAARAGEQGRGFAVVADEVRALAHRTQQSTQEIEQMIGAVLEGSEQATRSMQESCTGAQDTLGVAHEAGVALDEIARRIEEINDMNTLIATASEEQAQVARSIDHNLISIRDLSVQSTEGANQTSLASGELSRLAIEMNGVVTRFKM